MMDFRRTENGSWISKNNNGETVVIRYDEVIKKYTINIEGDALQEVVDSLEEAKENAGKFPFNF